MSRLEKWVTYLGAKAPAGEVIIPEDAMFKELAEVEKVFSKDKEEMLAMRPPSVMKWIMHRI